MRKFHSVYTASGKSNDETQAAYDATSELNRWLESIENEWQHVEIIDLHMVVNHFAYWVYYMSIVVLYWND